MDLWTFGGVDVSVACLHLVRLASYKNVSFYSNHTIGTNGPSELPCTQLHHMENNLSPLKEMHIHRQNHWKDMLFYWYQLYHLYQWTIGIALYQARSHKILNPSPLYEMHIHQ